MIWILAGLAGLAVVWLCLWSLCAVAGRADDAAEAYAARIGLQPQPPRPRQEVQPDGRVLAGGAVSILDTLDVWDANPSLTYFQARAIAARRLQEFRAPGPLG